MILLYLVPNDTPGGWHLTPALPVTNKLGVSSELV